MTCIVAVTDGKKVTIGGDSAGCSGYRRDVRADGQLLRYNLHVNGRPQKMDPVEYMSTWFIDAVRTTLKAGGFAKVENMQERGGCFLVGYRGGIYEIESDFQCGIPTTGYAAVGCGDDFALGALHAMEDEPHNAKIRITKALAAAAKFSGWVAPPYVIVEEPKS